LQPFYFALKNLVLWARSEFFGSALEFGVSNNKSQAPPNLKIGPNKSHAQRRRLRRVKSKFQTGSKRLFNLFGILNFGHCYLFVFWDLLFGISVSQ